MEMMMKRALVTLLSVIGFVWAAAAETNSSEYDHAFEDDYHGIWDSVAAFVSTGEWDEADLLITPASVGGVHVFTGFAV